MNNYENKISFDEETLKIFASRIRELRTERELTMEALGNILGYSRSSISMYELASRVPDIKVLSAYSEFFDVPIDYLVGKTNQRKPLYAVACFSDISANDMEELSDDAMEDIRNFIKFTMNKRKK
mgnify:CR=1 FL=1